MALRLCLLGLAAALALAPGAGASAPAADSFAGVAFSPFTIDPANGDCTPDASVGRYCDPINILFPGQSLGTVVARLHAAGWTDTTGTTQWLSLDGGPLVAVQAQLQVADGPDPTQRYHVRLWQASPSLTIGNVHHEHGSPHRIDLAWDAAEAFLAGPLCSSWCGRAPLPAQAALEGGTGSWRGWPNDAVATVVPVAPPPAGPIAAKPKPHVHRKHR